jgi:cytochrome P450
MLAQEYDYPDPSSFNPERFLKDGGLDSTVRDPAAIAFGFGRRRAQQKFSLHTCTDSMTRICPGSHFALTTVWLTVTSVLSAFTISKPVDSDGSVVEPTVEYTNRVLASVCVKQSYLAYINSAIPVLRYLSSVQ